MADQPQTWHHGLVARYWAEHNTGGPEAAYFRQKLEGSGEPALDAGCGTGRLLIPFLQAGLDVDGCDVSADMLSFCRGRAEREGLKPQSLITLWRTDCGYFEQPGGPSSWTQYEATTDSLGNTYVATSAYDDGRVIKVSRAGTAAWSKGFGTASFDVALDVATFDGSEVFVGGMTKGFLVHRQLGKGDALLCVMNSSGAQVWTR